VLWIRIHRCLLFPGKTIGLPRVYVMALDPTRDQVDWCEGNEQVFVDLPPDDSISVGHIVDKESEVAFFFIYNSTGRHQIRRWDPNANNSVGEVEVVAEGAALGFTPNTRIHHGTFIDNTFLCWVDGKIEGYDISGTEPRKLDISKATEHHIDNGPFMQA
jgi:hypothetical protein